MNPVILIRPSFLIDKDSVQTIRGVPSLGVAYLAGALKKNNIPLKIIDGPSLVPGKLESFYHQKFNVLGADNNEIINEIPHGCLFVGISCLFSSEWLYHKSLIAAIKTARPELTIIAGGEHISSDPEYALASCPELDLAVIGEGEETIVELAEYFKGEKSDFTLIKGIIFRNAEEGFVKTDKRSRIKKIDEISWPDWESYPLEHYLNAHLSIQETKKVTMPVLGTRGCPYKCTFCTNVNMWGIQWIPRDPADIISEIKTYVEKYNVSYIEFWDLTFLINKQWTRKFCEQMIESGLNIEYGLPSGTRSEVLDQEILQLLKQSGLKRINFSPENGSDYILKIIQKRADLDKFLKVMKASADAGLIVTANIVLGFPGERKIDVIRSFIYIIKMVFAGVHDLYLLPYAPYPGSEIFNNLVSEGKIDKSREDYAYFLAKSHYIKIKGIKSYSNALSGISINILFIGGRLFFYGLQYLIRPWRFIHLVKNIASNEPQTYFERLILGVWKNFI